jgi:hypothetical protein
MSASLCFLLFTPAKPPINGEREAQIVSPRILAYGNDSCC